MAMLNHAKRNENNHLLQQSQYSAQQKAALASIEKEAALKRLKEAESRLREAIQDLHANHSNKEDWYRSLFSSTHPLCQHCDSCIANCISSLCQSFLLAYGIRVGVGVLLRAFKLAKNKSYLSILDLKLLLSERNLIVREEACRIGLLFGGFSGCYHGMHCILRRLRNRETLLNTFIAGGFSGLSILSLNDASRRRSLALYLLFRLLQCCYNSMKVDKKVPFLGSKLRHGGMLFFSLACAQVMYAYVMCPESLPEQYIDFIIRLGPIAKPVLKAVRQSCNREPIDIMALSEYCSSKHGESKIELDHNCSLIPCSIIHPETSSCIVQINQAMGSTFKKILPLYVSLKFVPFVILNLNKFMESPMGTIWSSCSRALQSSCFLSAFVGIYQSYICVQRKLVTRDHKLVYWFGGVLASLSILLERKTERIELALYVLSNAANSLWYMLVKRHLIPEIPYAEVFLFCLCMGGIMFFYEHEPRTMPPIFQRLIHRFLNPNIISGQFSPESVSKHVDQLSDRHDVQFPATAHQGLEKQVEENPEILETLKIDGFHGL